jgi:hypothetical protein
VQAQTISVCLKDDKLLRYFNACSFVATPISVHVLQPHQKGIWYVSCWIESTASANISLDDACKHVIVCSPTFISYIDAHSQRARAGAAGMLAHKDFRHDS